MKVLITGAKGFIGKNLFQTLANQKNIEILQYDIESSQNELIKYTESCDFIFHLAGINRPEKDEDFMKGNFGFTNELLDLLQKHNNKCPIMISSSIQAKLDNPYGKSKKAGEDLILEYGKNTGAKVLVYRLPNVFGKWCRPNYNSAVATFSHNIANNLPIEVNDPNALMNLVYIDDVIRELVLALNGKENRKGDYCYIEPVYSIKLGEIAKLLYSFRDSRQNLEIPNTKDSFVKKLYSNYLSYLPKNDFLYDLKMNSDHRGSFTEFIRTADSGQVSVNISKPGITKGNHWHNTKNEKFLVVKGTGLISFRKIDEYEIVKYYVSGEKLQVVDIPPGYTHNIKNIGDTEMVTIMWANEKFDPDNPDTLYLEV